MGMLNLDAVVVIVKYRHSDISRQMELTMIRHRRKVGQL